MGTGPKTMQVRVPMELLEPQECDCGGKYFFKIHTLNNIPLLYRPTPQFRLLATETGFVCTSCGKAYVHPEDKELIRQKQEKLKERIVKVSDTEFYFKNENDEQVGPYETEFEALEELILYAQHALNDNTPDVKLIKS